MQGIKSITALGIRDFTEKECHHAWGGSNRPQQAMTTDASNKQMSPLAMCAILSQVTSFRTISQIVLVRNLNRPHV